MNNDGSKEVIVQMKHIICEMEITDKSLHPHPTVIVSDMPTFERGDTIDPNQMMQALKQGYRVIINPIIHTDGENHV